MSTASRRNGPGRRRPGQSGPRPLYTPRRTNVGVGENGRPALLAGVRVESIREEWLVEDRWWTASPVRRRYFELVLSNGRNAVVFHSGIDGEWYGQRA